MGQRNMMIDQEMDQQAQGYIHPEPCIFFGGVTSYPPQPDIPTVITAAGNIPNLDAHLPEHYENVMFYGFPQYHPSVQHHTHASNIDMGVPTAPNFYIPYVAAHGSPIQLPSSSNHGVIPLGESERNSLFLDNGRGSYKRKNTEGNSQYLNIAVAPSTSFTPLSTTDGASFTFPQFRGTGNPPPPPPRELGSQRSVRNRMGAASMVPFFAHHAQNNFIQGSYMCQPYPPPGSQWVDHHLSSNGTNGGPSPWSHAPSLPYMHGSNAAGGSLESGNIALSRYHETPSNRSSTAFVYPSPVNPRHNYLSHHPSPPSVQGTRGHNTVVYPPGAPTSYGVPVSYTSPGSVHDGLEMGSSHLGAAQPTGFRIYRHNRDGSVPETNLRHRNLPHLRVMPADEVALLDVGDFYDAGNYVDHHRDMRLDIEDMSYEELLALSERIGSVNTGLSEETVTSKLRTRIYLSSAINLEEAPPMDQEPDSCTICQENYKNREKIGSLDCGHEYHADCLKKWLYVKNVCPICKSEALAPGKKDV